MEWTAVIENLNGVKRKVTFKASNLGVACAKANCLREYNECVRDVRAITHYNEIPRMQLHGE